MIFPSTSEVYGMCPDEEFNEDESPLVVGPINKAALDIQRLKAAPRPGHLGLRLSERLRFTLFRPFNWIGPKLDDLYAPRKGSSRVVTQFISNMIHGDPIQLSTAASRKGATPTWTTA